MPPAVSVVWNRSAVSSSSPPWFCGASAGGIAWPVLGGGAATLDSEGDNDNAKDRTASQPHERELHLERDTPLRYQGVIALASRLRQRIE